MEMLEEKKAILVVDHGSRNAQANASLEEVGRLVREALGESKERVYVAHMELAPPGIDEVIEQCAADGVESLVVVPYMLAAGRHATEDIPRLTKAACLKHGIHCTIRRALGPHPLLAELVVCRAKEA